MKIKTYQQSYPIGTSISGRVIHIQSFGVFVELTATITGLLKTPYFCITKKPIQFPYDFPKIGDTISAYILAYEAGSEKVYLMQISRDSIY
ncbi:hypothetical protein MNBD_GAMMA12-3809 [hydrothermal vent metagenome]|uniref:S1 motif domain-containing protein n=1 Tax=hydrothermal vent metagenome TaxID=652676 RepID=A0A3B0YRJ7_9ZZZZ